MDDLAEVLHEELGRLPQRYREVVVLCLLEGLSPDQAARRLGCPVGTVHSRLARGRERLRDRLTQRGLAPVVGMIGAALAGDVAAAVMPGTLAHSTVHSAIRFAAGRMSNAERLSASVCELTKGGLKMMRFADLKTTASLVAALSFVFGASVVAQYQPANQPAGVVTRNRTILRSESSSAVAEPGGDVEKELRRLERVWANGLANRDRAAVDRILAEDIIVTDPVGRTWDKARYLEPSWGPMPGASTPMS